MLASFVLTVYSYHARRDKVSVEGVQSFANRTNDNTVDFCPVFHTKLTFASPGRWQLQPSTFAMQYLVM